MPTFRPGKPWGIGSLTANRSVAAGLNPITWDVEDGDPGGGWSGPDYTIPTSGMYLLTGGALRQGTGTASIIFAEIVVNGQAVTSQYLNTTAVAMVVSLARYLSLEAGDTVRLNVQGHVSATSTLGQYQTFLSIVRLGPVRWT